MGAPEKELMMLRFQFRNLLQPVKSGDLLTGRIQRPLIGFCPELRYQSGLGYVCQEDEIRKAMAQMSLKPARREQVMEALEFWRTESTQARTRAACPAWVNETLSSDDRLLESGKAFCLYRMGGTQLDYGKLLELGLPGLRHEIESRQTATSDTEARELFGAMLGALDLLAESCRYYATQARGLAADCGDADLTCTLSRLAEMLESIIVRAPATLREAMQLMWLYVLMSGTWNYGRMDVYFGPFLSRDLENGVLTVPEALELVKALWRLMKDGNECQHNNRVYVGGKGRPDEASADRFALLAMEASRTVHLNQPQLSLRFYKGQNPMLMDKALEALGEGCTFPILYNDDVNIPAVMHAFRVSEAEAMEYVPFGCGEYVLNHRSVGTPSGTINLTKCLEIALNNGVDPVTGREIGLRTGDPETFDTFEQLWEAYRAQVDRCVAALAAQEKIEYDVAGTTAPFLFLSMLYDDCLARGRGIFSGGVRYLGGTLESYGNTNAANSLAAIHELVFRQKKYTLPEILAACRANFEGYEHLRQDLLAAPKYGNDDPVADAMAVRVHEHICHSTRDQAAKVGLDSYLTVIINNAMNVTFGRQVSASPDGRLRGEYLANANNPFPGTDRQGVTAFLNSLVKLDPAIHAGAVQNMKFSRSMFTTSLPKLKALLDAYFAQGGAQAMLNVVNRSDLEAAMHEPEKWGHLMVRVGGFSARFIDLEPDVQREILKRTLNE